MKATIPCVTRVTQGAKASEAIVAADTGIF